METERVSALFCPVGTVEREACRLGTSPLPPFHLSSVSTQRMLRDDLIEVTAI
jgi:hypothetical protein